MAERKAGPNKMSELWTPSRLAIAHPTLFTSKEIELFEEEILSNPNSNEHDASNFFSHFPKFLYLGQGTEIKREVVMYYKDDEEFVRVDFFRRSFGTAFWDIIEIKGPQKQFAVKNHSQHYRISSTVQSAVDQAKDYRDLIIENSKLREELFAKGIQVLRPRILVVVGKQNARVPDEKMQVLYDRIHNESIEALPYDGILNFAKEHYKSNYFTIIPIAISTAESYMRTAIENVLLTLSKREEKVLRLRYGFDSHNDRRLLTLQEIGTMLNLSASRISQIETKAFNKLREPNRRALLFNCLEADSSGRRD